MGHDPAAGERLKAFMEPRIGRVQPWAERHGIGRDTIYALWRGREPVPDTINRLAAALGVSYRELMDVREGVSARQEATETNDAVAAAIDRQTAVLERLLGEWFSRWDASARPDEALESEAEAAIVSTRETLRGQRPRPLHTEP